MTAPGTSLERVGETGRSACFTVSPPERAIPSGAPQVVGLVSCRKRHVSRRTVGAPEIRMRMYSTQLGTSSCTAGRPGSVSADTCDADVHARSASTPQPLTIGFREALALTGFKRNTLYRLLRGGYVPGAQKIGGTWRFNRAILVQWLTCTLRGSPRRKRR